jgi:hypothetical protein
VRELESIKQGLNSKMIDQVRCVQKKNRIGRTKANQIYERFMDYDQKKKRNKLNRKMENIDKENRVLRRQTSKSRYSTPGVNSKADFL